MKKVVQKTPETQFVKVKNANDRKYYGFVKLESDGSVGSVGFVTRENFDCGLFKAMCCRAVTQGNTWSDWDSDSLVGILQKIVSRPDLKVCEFNHSSELFKWLGEQCVGKSK